MTWTLWRQHRAQLAIALALLLAFTAPMWVTGRRLTSALALCRRSPSCSGGSLFQNYQLMVILVDLTILVPLVIGVFWGATLVGRELETGTAALAWTQSVSRRRWVASKIGTLLAFSAAYTGAVGGLVSWWSRTRNVTVESRFGGLPFDIQGVVPVGYGVFAAALGLAAGALWRRTLPAMATTIGGFVGLRVVVDSLLRPHYMTPVTRYAPLTAPDGPPNGSWQISLDLMRHGAVVNGPVRLPRGCGGQVTSRQEANDCLTQLGYRMRSVYQPAGRFWDFQWIEFGIYAGLATVLVVVAVVVLRRRDV